MEQQEKDQDNSTTWAGASSLLTSVNVFHPFSYRIPAITQAYIEAGIKLSAIDKNNTELINGYRRIVKNLLDAWEGDSTGTENPARWHNLIVTVSRDFNTLVSAHPYNTVELADAFGLMIRVLLSCVEYEATNYRPKGYVAGQDVIEWTSQCADEKDSAIIEILYGQILADDAALNTYLHRKRLESIASLYHFVYDIYKTHLPKYFKPSPQLIQSFYQVQPTSIDNSSTDLDPLPERNSIKGSGERVIMGMPYYAKGFSSDLCDETAENAGVIHSKANKYGLLPGISPAKLCGFVEALLKNGYLLGDKTTVLRQVAILYNVKINRKGEYPENLPGGRGANMMLRSGRMDTEKALIKILGLQRGLAYYHVKADKIYK